MKKVVITGSFDDIRSQHVRLLQEAARFGDLHVLLWSDEAAQALEGKTPKFPQEERSYLLQAIRYVKTVSVFDGRTEGENFIALAELKPDIWVVDENGESAEKMTFCIQNHIKYQVIKKAQLAGFPVIAKNTGVLSHRKKALVTGCFDWFHSGHVRFFEEVSEIGDLYVVVGHDANLRLLKGEGHPLFPEDERRYMVQSVRYVTQAIVSSGHGWMDAEPEINLLKPDMYVVNEDGDKPEKRQFCKERGLEYVVLMRKPKDGLPRRQSTDLRGF